MKIKFNRNKTVSCKLVWKRRIVSEKGFSEKRAERIAQRCIDLIERMQYGNAMIAFYKQDGTFCMEKGTLVGYEKFFYREYKSTAR
ncbi:SH3 beta-barrel fold-containing protein, partial [Bacteroides ovatus]